MQRTARVLATLVVAFLIFNGRGLRAEPLDHHVRGVVTDSSGATLSGVSVVATLAGLPLATTVTNDAGAYEFTGLPASTLNLTFRASGFAPAELKVTVDGDAWAGERLTRFTREQNRRAKRTLTGTAVAASSTHTDR